MLSEQGKFDHKWHTKKTAHGSIIQRSRLRECMHGPETFISGRKRKAWIYNVQRVYYNV